MNLGAVTIDSPSDEISSNFFFLSVSNDSPSPGLDGWLPFDLISLL